MSDGVGFAGGVELVLTVSQGAVARLPEVLERVAHVDRLRGARVAVVHAASIADVVEERIAETSGISVRLIRAGSGSKADAAASAVKHLSGSHSRYACVAMLPRLREVQTFVRQVIQEIERLVEVPRPRNAPLLLWTRGTTRQSVSAYVHTVLDALNDDANMTTDYLAGLSLRAANPLLEIVNPQGEAIEIHAWLAAGFSPEMPEPRWHYRLLLIGKAGETLCSEPIKLTQRVDKHGILRWENLTGKLSLRHAKDGNYKVALEVESASREMRIRREMRPRAGVLLGARTVIMRDDEHGDTLRYLVHASANPNETHIAVQSGGGRKAARRWSLMLVKKDFRYVLRRTESRRMRMLRLVRLVTSILYARRDIWLIGERHATAQDNGLHLFAHLRETHPNRAVYYVIDKDSPQYDRVRKFGNVVAHSSLRHRLMMLHVKVLANAYSIHYMIPRQWDANRYAANLAWRVGAVRVYLKHGIHLSPNAVKRGATGYDLCLTAMPRESEALRATSGYAEQVAEVGLPRYDALTPTPPSRTVLFMSTWRRYLVPKLFGGDDQVQLEFEGSNYEKFISSFLTSNRLQNILEKHNYRLLFLPHHNMAPHFDSVRTAGSRVEIADLNASSIQDLIRQCDAFITDHSSVHFDVAYVGTPIIYARFDRDEFETKHASPSWFDYERDGFGPVVYTLEDTLDALERVLKRGAVQDRFYQSRIDAAFTFKDTSNCARAVAAIDQKVRSLIH